MAAQGKSLKPERRFYELDVLRGLAAIVVVTFHYKHFFLTDAGSFDYTDMPLHQILMPVYVYGQFFVELFFSISGYVFFWLYSEAIATRKIGLRSFAIARFARLYPLYLVTLIFVALAQGAFRSLYGHDYIYSDNTTLNFVLNLVMAQQWPPDANQTFNGPGWSISVEVFLYIVFFALCRFRLQSAWSALALIVAGLLFKYIHFDPTNDFVRGLPSFFLGGLAWYAVEALKRRAPVCRYVVWGLGAALPLMWALAYLGGYDSLWGAEQAARAAQGLPRQGVHAVLLSIASFAYVLIPLTLVFFGLKRGTWREAWMQTGHLKRWSWIGDISYSLYLIHFPLQITLMLFLSRLPFAVRAHIFSSPFAYLAFMATAMGLAWLSYRYFEMPLRKQIRDWLAPRLARLAPLR